MIANLPLLFANSNPTALSDIGADKLEKFITFMVTCSWGHDTAKDIRQPPWWPMDVEFCHPFVRPQEVPKNWEARLRNLVRKCYDYHKSAFLLVFSAQLSRYPRKRLRYVDNRDHTTSLYYTPNGRLLVTFRNENIFYDRAVVNDMLQVDSKPTDIYLCDSCDSHFDNLDILKAHERLCNNEVSPTGECSSGLPELLSALKLQQVGAKFDKIKPDITNEVKFKTVRNAANIDRGPPFPFSSLAYIRNVKSVQRDTNFNRERIERYCCTSIPISKIVVNKGKNHQFPVRYRRPIDYWHRTHIFPQQRNKRILDLKAQLRLLKCRPVNVDVERMSIESMEKYVDKTRKESEKKLQQLMEDKDIVFVENIMECDQPCESELKPSDPLKRTDNDCEVIDLCSDDESQSVNENCDPRVGITCVMRGGAVLRRTAATPQSLPAEPCGARQRPLPQAVLKPHPVFLITRTLNSIQSISID